MDTENVESVDPPPIADEDEETPDGMVDVEFSTSENDGDPIRQLIRELGLDISELGLEDQEDFDELEKVQQELDEMLASPQPPDPAVLEESYALLYRLRSSCIAHLLQLVIKDGLKSLDVSSKRDGIL